MNIKTIPTSDAMTMQAMQELKAMRPLHEIDPLDTEALNYRASLVEIVSKSVRDQKYITLRDSLIDGAYERAIQIVGTRGSTRQKDLTFLAEMTHRWRREVIEGRSDA